MMYLMVDWDSPRRDLILQMVGSTIIPIMDNVGLDEVEVDVARLPAYERERLLGVGGEGVRYVVALGDDVTIVETSKVY